MIKQLDAALNKVNKMVGVNVKTPKVTKSRLKYSRYLTTVIGVGGLTLGIMSSSKSLLVLGTIGILSAIATTIEIRKI
ncbi:hypothetical protein ABE61_17155 [Lysinibacillus sphaericus]|uniref:hypothetical protein n=1 Tax=Lysinibacillus sphaericus TaxID=1421 RepID=UPI0018CE15E1|nr:hypothetical protein [Lysinibacillus sphaericus]MBG9455735.1 hypothetical protein [Lysinibacillus sphaericus]MBG9477754.1 hypothetical protein [Lysinibacillus sphaericus]MBG9593213.1 hypothetical protein [Lysinibacillus sphaericus]